MNNELWYKILDIKCSEIYLSKYLSRQQNFRKYFQILTLILSGSGVLGWKFFEDYAWIAFILIATMQLLLLIENQLIFSEKEVDHLKDLKILHKNYLLKLERLWSKYWNYEMNDGEVSEQYFKYKEYFEMEVDKINVQINISRNRKMHTKAEDETLEYINKYFKYE